MLLPLLALVASLVSADTTRYAVDNHGRTAGEMVIVTNADSVSVRWVFTDRNRGSRVETRYRIGAGGTPVAGEMRPLIICRGPLFRFRGPPPEAFFSAPWPIPTPFPSIGKSRAWARASMIWSARSRLGQLEANGVRGASVIPVAEGRRDPGPT